jgi:hypothetical protein
MNKMRPSTAKILVHSEGLGAPNADVVRQRAREIAFINGREEFSEADWHQAKLELHGSQGSDHHGEEAEAAQMVSERDMIACDAGHHTERVLMEDDGNIVEELISEGMDEAEHERMIEARRESNAEDLEDAED